MKVAIILGQFSVGNRPLDFHYDNIWVSTRGLTGTDLCFVKLSEELQARGHEIHMFTVHAQPNNKPSTWKGMRLYNFEECFSVIDDSFDSIISINEPEIFRGLPSKPLRIVWQMLNDFTYCGPGYENFVDQFLGVCPEHTTHLRKQISPDKWETVALGCSPESYEDKRVPGRVIWCSSADRGLHWLLSQWPEIKKNVPEANLKIFYHFNYGSLTNIEPNSTSDHVHVVEMANRVRYIKNSIDKMKHLEVEHVGSVSRQQMQKEFSEASVFGFSCDTIAFSEGFSVSTMEAHASYTVPVITSQDCLGGIYKNSGCVMIDAPIKNKLNEFTNGVIKSLKDKEFADQSIEKCRQFANQHTWQQTAEQMENIIIKGLNEK